MHNRIMAYTVSTVELNYIKPTSLLQKKDSQSTDQLTSSQKQIMEDEKEVAVVVFPFTGQSHLNQQLHFSLNLCSKYRALSVHYVSSGPLIRQTRARIHGWDPSSVARIHFHELPVPPPDSVISPTSFPLHVWEAYMKCDLSITSLLQSLSSTSRRLVVVYDAMMTIAGRIADSFPNAESYMFCCTASFFSLSNSYNKDQAVLNSSAEPPSEEAIRMLRKPLPDIAPPEVWDFIIRNMHEVDSHAGDIVNSCRGIEGEFLDIYEGEPRLRGKKVFAVGPLCPIAVKRKSEHDVFDWLDKQPAASVVYVSFGSTTVLSDEQIEQLALGLKKSEQRYILVLPDADHGNYEEEVVGIGLVIRGWAPQLDILAHAATGAFISHCGWNSCMESLSMGVPIVTWPMSSDQPINEVMITEYLKVGVSVRDWVHQKELVTSEMIEEAITKVMVGEEATEMRKRVRSMSKVIRAAVAEGGSSTVDFDSFVAHITR